MKDLKKNSLVRLTKADLKSVKGGVKENSDSKGGNLSVEPSGGNSLVTTFNLGL